MPAAAAAVPPRRLEREEERVLEREVLDAFALAVERAERRGREPWVEPLLVLG